MEKIKSQKLFVMGHARSGTSFTMNLLNSSEDVFLLTEAHIFESYWNNRFVVDFNARQGRTSRVKSKGTRLPAQFEGMLPEEVLQFFSQHYKWFGEKIAIGPMSGFGAVAASKAIDYHLANHLDANYILTFRSPVPSLRSLQRVFPGLSTTLLLQGWMISFIEIVSAGNIFKNVVLAPLEFYSFDYWSKIQRKLGLSGRADVSWFDADKGKAASPDIFKKIAQIIASECSWNVKEAEDFLNNLNIIYEEFLCFIDKDTLYFKKSTSFVGYIDQLLLKVDGLLEILKDSYSTSKSLPVSACGWLKNGKVQKERQVLPLPNERLHRFSITLRESLFSERSSIFLTDGGSPYPLTCEGIDLVRENGWLYLKPLPGFDHHKSLLVFVPIEPLTIATFRLRLRPGEGRSRFVMMQMGNSNGFSSTLVDCRMQEIVSMSTVGSVKDVLSQVEAAADGDLRIAVSAIFGDREGSYLRVYLCDEKGSIDFQQSEMTTMISDLVLSYSYEDCGLSSD